VGVAEDSSKFLDDVFDGEIGARNQME